MKKCNKCGEVLPLHMFCKNKATKDKLNDVCKECKRKNYKAYRDKSKEKLLEYQREWISKLPDSYILQLLNNQGIDKSLITPEIMELKRATIKVTRIIKQKESKNI